MPISEIELNWSIPLNVINQISKIQCFIVENAKVSRHFLKQVNPKIIWDNVLIFENRTIGKISRYITVCMFHFSI